MLFLFDLLFMTDLTKRSNICGRTSSFKTEDVVNEFCEVNVVAARRELVASELVGVTRGMVARAGEFVDIALLLF